MTEQNRERVAVQTEEIEPGDILPNWTDGRDAVVRRAYRRGPGRVMVEVEGPAPSLRSYLANRTVTVLREGFKNEGRLDD